jgi:hypothetical protein
MKKKRARKKKYFRKRGSGTLAKIYKELRRIGYSPKRSLMGWKNRKHKKRRNPKKTLRSSTLLVKIYNKFHGVDTNRNGRVENLYASGSVNSGTDGVKKGDRFKHHFSTKPYMYEAQGQTPVRAGQVVISRGAVWGAVKSGKITLPSGSKILKGPKRLWRRYH